MYMYLFGILLLGIVVLVHEFGHFIFARLFGVKVHIFSIGFGKALLKKKWGDTEYRLSLVPLGGYVKMLGESPNDAENVTPEERSISFSGKTWWQKVLIVFAGPLFNIVFAFLVFFAAAFFDFYAPSSVLEFVSRDGAAYEAGLSDGDRIVEIDGKPVAVWDDISPSLPNEGGECGAVEVKVKKAFTGEDRTYTVNTRKGSYSDPFGEEHSRCELGVARVPREPTIALLKDFGRLQSGDMVLSIDGKTVSRFYEIEEIMKRPFKSMIVLRDGKEEKLDFAEDAGTPEFVYGGLRIASVENGSYSEKIGVREGDVFVGLNEAGIFDPYQFYAEMRKLKEGDPVRISIVRDGERQDIEFTASYDEKENEMTGMKSRMLKWGAMFSFGKEAEEDLAKRNGLWSYPARFAWNKMSEIITVTFKGFGYMISGKLPAKSLGGPIMIFDISKRAAEAGLKYFLVIVGVISVNLGIINLFPVPVLDGGYVVMYLIEGAARREIPKSVKEKALMVGFILLMALMAFAIVNDFARYIPMFFRN